MERPPIYDGRSGIERHLSVLAAALLTYDGVPPFATLTMKSNRSIPTPRLRRFALEQRRTLKMASSPHAYVRGSTVQFYKWLQERGARAVPQGPEVWICGDCHAGNLGPVADAKGKIHVQIRDL